MDDHTLKQLRKGRGLTLWALATTTGISTGTLSAIERYNYIPTLARQNKIAAALDVPVSHIWPCASNTTKTVTAQ